MVLNIFTLIGAIALFLYGLYIMNKELQKLTADLSRMFLPFMTSASKAKSAFGGFGLTALIQSSSATTVTVANYVNAGMMSINQAVAVIMGANIGTTITAWLITLLIYTLNLAPYAFVILAVGFVLSTFRNHFKLREFGQLVIGISLIIISLSFLQDSLSEVLDSGDIDTYVSVIEKLGFFAVVAFTIIGTGVSALIHSSSATVILAIFMLNMGVLDFESATAIVFGANIGTCITATIVTKDGNIRSRQTAFIHFIFNFGVALVLLILFRPFIAICSIIDSLSYAVCLSHTLFNLIGTLIFIWFIDKLVVWLDRFAPKEPAIIGNQKLKHINRRFQGTPALSISQAFKEIVNFGNICYEDFNFVKALIIEKNERKFEDYCSKLLEYEIITDKLEEEIATFLSDLNKNELSPEQHTEIKILYRVINELESLGDSGENISLLLQRQKIHKSVFDVAEIGKINILLSAVDKAFKVMTTNLRGLGTALFSMEDAYSAEESINSLRDLYRNEAIESVSSSGNTSQSVNYYLSTLSELESIGDYILNVSEALDEKYN